VLVAQDPPPPLADWLGRIEDGVAASEVATVMRTIQALVPAYAPSADIRAVINAPVATSAGAPEPAAMPFEIPAGARLRRLPPQITVGDAAVTPGAAPRRVVTGAS
jgi:hypothetical protein